MSSLRFTDSFGDLRNWNGLGYIVTETTFSSPSSVRADTLTSKITWFDATTMSIRLYDTLGTFSLKLSIDGNEIIKISGNSANYTVTENGNVTTSSVSRFVGWHLIQVTMDGTYRVSVDGTVIFTSTNAVRHGFGLILTGGIWDDLIVDKTYVNDYQGGTGSQDDLKVQDLSTDQDGNIQYTTKGGYFYVDDIEYYQFATLGNVAIEANPSGAWTFPSGIPYIPGEPYFIVGTGDIDSTGGFVRTPVNRDYMVSWEPATSGYQPTVSGAYDSRLVYEAGEERLVSLLEPIHSTKLVLTDEGGTATSIRSDSSYIDYAKIGDTYEAFAEVLDTYGGPVSGVTVTWKKIDASNVITTAGTSTTNDRGIATITIAITEEGPLHIYAEVNPTSVPDWIRIPLPIQDVLGSIFQLDNTNVRFDSQEARTALGQNIWGEYWGTDPSEGTGLGFPNPTTHGQWEDAHQELRRPPFDQTLSANESAGSWNATDFQGSYASIVTAGAGIDNFMESMYVARKGYWGQRLVSGTDIADGDDGNPIASGQVQNRSEIYEIRRDYAVTSGTYDTVRTDTATYGSTFYVFYQPGSAYVSNSPNMSGIWFFRGVAMYEEDPSQANSQIEDLISDAELQ